MASRLLRDLDKPVRCAVLARPAHHRCVGWRCETSDASCSRVVTDKDRQAAVHERISRHASSTGFGRWSMPLARVSVETIFPQQPWPVRALRSSLVGPCGEKGHFFFLGGGLLQQLHRIARPLLGAGWGAIIDGMASVLLRQS